MLAVVDMFKDVDVFKDADVFPSAELEMALFWLGAAVFDAEDARRDEGPLPLILSFEAKAPAAEVLTKPRLAATELPGNRAWLTWVAPIYW